MKVHGSTIKRLCLVSEGEYQHEFTAAPFINLLKTMPNVNFLKIKIFDGKFTDWIACEPFMGEKEKITFHVNIYPRSELENLYQIFIPQSIVKVDQMGYFNGTNELLILHNASLTHVNILAYYYHHSLIFKPLKNLKSFKINSYDHRDSEILNYEILQLCKDHPDVREVEVEHESYQFCIEMTPEVLSAMCEMAHLKNLQLKVNQSNIMYFHCLRLLQKFTKVSLEVEKLSEEELLSLTSMSFENFESIELLLMKRGISTKHVLQNIGRNWPNIKCFKIIDYCDSTKWILESFLHLQELTVECNEHHPVPMFQIEKPYPKITSLTLETRCANVMWNNFPAAFPKLSFLKGHVRYSKELLKVLCSMDHLKDVEINIWTQSVENITEMSDESEWQSLMKLFRKVPSASIIYWNHTYVSMNALYDQLKNCDFIKMKLKQDPEHLSLKRV